MLSKFTDWLFSAMARRKGLAAIPGNPIRLRDYYFRRLSILARRTYLEEALFTCPACGFRTLDNPSSYEICLLCWWMDDEDDLWSPESTDGVNRKSLVQWQRNVLIRFPIDIREYRRLQRDPDWRPISKEDLLAAPRKLQEREEKLEQHRKSYPPQYWLWKQD